MAIDREFREAGIEIAFPQQDVHVRPLDGGWNAIRSVFTEPDGDPKKRHVA